MTGPSIGLLGYLGFGSASASVETALTDSAEGSETHERAKASQLFHPCTLSVCYRRGLHVSCVECEWLWRAVEGVGEGHSQPRDHYTAAPQRGSTCMFMPN